MKNLIILKITKSLCAFFLIFALLVCANPLALYAEDVLVDDLAEGEGEGEPSGGALGGEVTTDPATGQGYRYCLDIYFGEMRFYYDWGTWNTTDLRYEANDSSTYPAKTTVAGDPGWYGFDGTMNKIAFVNSSPNADSIFVRLEYVTEPYGTDADFPSLHSSVSMEFYNDKEFANQLYYDSALENAVIMEVPHSVFSEPDANGDSIRISTDVYVSMSGAPYLVEKDPSGGAEVIQDMFHATSDTSIGFLRVTVGVEREDLIESVPQVFSYQDNSFYENEYGEIVELGEETTTTETTSVEETTTTETTSVEETTTTETTSVEETTTTETTSVEETTTTETTSVEETTTTETTSVEETTTTETTSVEETTTTETTFVEETTTTETTSVEETTTTETTSVEETTTTETTSVEETTTEESISTE